MFQSLLGKWLLGKWQLLQWSVCVAAAMACTSAFAHHSRAAIDTTTTVTLHGVISKKSWRNPHVYYELKVSDQAAGPEVWTLEGQSVSSLTRRGWENNSINVGDVVEVTLNPYKDHSKRYGSLRSVTLANGTVFSTMRGQSTRVARAAPEPVEPSTDYSGTWTISNPVNRGGAIGNEAVSPPKDWPLTAKGLADVAKFSVRDDPVFDCIFYGLPRLSTSVYSRRWTRYDNRIEIQQEQYNVKRVIWLDGRSMPADYKPNKYGFSTGHFEADGTLVVDTAGFTFTRWGNATGIDASTQKKLVERYKLGDDGLHMEFSYTIIDPVYLTKPVTESLQYRKIAPREYVYETCDIENARKPLEALGN